MLSRLLAGVACLAVAAAALEAAVPVPARAGAGSRIAYSRGCDLYTMALDGSDQTLLVSADDPRFWDALCLGEPVWSPAGTRLAFSELEVFVDVIVATVYRIDADGSNLVVVTGSAVSPAWSADGAWIAFKYRPICFDDPGCYEDPWPIYKVRVDGTERTPLTTGSAGYPSWSPIGDRIVFEADDGDGDSEVYVMNADGSGVVQLTNNTGVDDWDPEWSADGSQIVFTSDRDGNSEIYSMHADGTGVVRLTDDPASDAQPSWDRAGQRIHFASNRAGNWEIHSMLVDGSDVRNLTRSSLPETEPDNGMPIISAGNTPPSITPQAVTRQQGATRQSTIAIVADGQTSPGSLTVRTTSVPPTVTATGLVNTTGDVSALIGASCAATPGPHLVGLHVSDGELGATGNLTVDVQANEAPSLGTYAAAEAAFLGSGHVTPDLPPQDEGTATLAASSPTFGGTLSVDSATGVVALRGARPSGPHTIEVHATDNCGATTTHSFTLTVAAPCSEESAPLMPDGRPQAATVASLQTRLFPFPVLENRSISVEAKPRLGSSSDFSMVLLGDHDGCGPTTTLVARDTSALAPEVTSGKRFSVVATDGGWYRAAVANSGADPFDLEAAVAETTLYNPAWSTNGSYDTYYSLQNTTNGTVSGTLRLQDLVGTTVLTQTVTIPIGGVVSLNTVSLAAPRNRTRVATFAHDGPPGAVLALAAIARFSVTPPYMQPVTFEGTRNRR